MLYGYGAYGMPVDINFNIVYLSALEEDWVLAFAHVRGGNEKGPMWHENGMKEKKINSFKDFINCAEYLVAERYTHPALLCAQGGSAGSLLVGTNMNV
jgi:oligopeptidase B